MLYWEPHSSNFFFLLPTDQPTYRPPPRYSGALVYWCNESRKLSSTSEEKDRWVPHLPADNRRSMDRILTSRASSSTAFQCFAFPTRKALLPVLIHHTPHPRPFHAVPNLRYTQTVRPTVFPLNNSTFDCARPSCQSANTCNPDPPRGQGAVGSPCLIPV